jgi:crotonobetainyl-CoA:carnitine CoA-transferase CaiB-like acyl-CoA transferase
MGKTVEEVVRRLDEADLVAAKIYDFRQIIEDPHIQERDMVTEVTHPIHGKLKLYGVAAKHSLTPGKVRTHAPMLGEHNDEIYQGLLGYGEDKLIALKGKDII